MADMPRRVHPVDGAEVVDFPWSEASAAVAALNDARAVLRDHVDGRVQMADLLTSWLGGHRETFNKMHADVYGESGSTEEELGRLAGAIVDGALSANERQVQLNRQAEMTAAG